jgi:hypothetical protein
MFCKVHSLSKFALIIMKTIANKFWWWHSTCSQGKDQKAVA